LGTKTIRLPQLIFIDLPQISFFIPIFPRNDVRFWPKADIEPHQCGCQPAALHFLVKKEYLMWWDYWPMHHFFFGPLFMIAFFVVCLILMMWMMRGHRHGDGGDALDLLSERYARGEINQAEYEERRRVLRS
jgi:putative membrane protein